MFRETAAALQARHAVLEADQAALEAQVGGAEACAGCRGQGACRRRSSHRHRLCLACCAQVLADFLRLMHQRKQDEVQHVNSQMAQLDQDIQQVRAGMHAAVHCSALGLCGLCASVGPVGTEHPGLN